MSSRMGGGYRYGPRVERSTALLDPAAPSPSRSRPQLSWHSGADLAVLLLRAVLAVIFLGHGAQKMFGAFGGPGLDGFATFLAQSGFRQAQLLAALTAVTELIGGALVLIGLATQLAAAGLLGVMINAIWLKASGGLLGAQGGDGYQLELALAALAGALVLVGAGRIALDRAVPMFRRPLVGGLPCLLLGVGAALAVRALLHG